MVSWVAMSNRKKCAVCSKWSVGKLVLFCCGALFCLSLISNVLLSLGGFYINISSSLPYGIYKVEYRHGIEHGLFGLKGIKDRTLQSLFEQSLSDEHGSALSAHIVERNLRPERGELVLACLNARLAAFASERNYLGAGKCPGGYAPVGKKVVALEGDYIAITSKGVLVNGVLQENSQLVAVDGQGRAMPAYCEVGGNYRLESDEVLLINEKAQSFDSRYFGPLKSYSIVARLYPYWLW